MTNLESLLAEVRELDAKATKQPWKYSPGFGVIEIEHRQKTVALIQTHPNDMEDAEFIARARTLLPRLAEIVQVMLKRDCVCDFERERRCLSCIGRDCAEEIAGGE